MFDIVQFPAFVLVVVALNLTPGPDITYIVGQTVAHGRRAGILSVLGISLGGCVHTILCAFGLTTLIAASPWAFTVIKYVGGVYLVYMGGKLLLYKATKSKNEVFIPRLTNRALVFRGFLTNVSNPKVLLFYITFFPQFVRPDSPNKTAAFIVLGAVFVALGFIHDSGVAWLAGNAVSSARLGSAGKFWMNRIVGLVFVALGVQLALSYHS